MYLEVKYTMILSSQQEPGKSGNIFDGGTSPILCHSNGFFVCLDLSKKKQYYIFKQMTICLFIDNDIVMILSIHVLNKTNNVIDFIMIEGSVVHCTCGVKKVI